MAPRTRSRANVNTRAFARQKQNIQPVIDSPPIGQAAINPREKFIQEHGGKTPEEVRAGLDAAMAQAEKIRNAPPVPQTFTNEKGQVTGYTLPNGKTVFGKESEIRDLIEKNIARQQLREGVAAAVTGGARTGPGLPVAEQTALLADQNRAIAQLTDQEQAQADAKTLPVQTTGETFRENAGQVIASGLSTGGQLAAGTGIAGANPYITAGAGIIGFGFGLYKALKDEQRNEQSKLSKDAFGIYTRAAERYKEHLDAANTGQIAASDIAARYETDVANMRYALQQLRVASSGLGGDELKAVNAQINEIHEYLSVDEPNKRIELINAIQKPNPQRIAARELPTQQDINILDANEIL